MGTVFHAGIQTIAQIWVRVMLCLFLRGIVISIRKLEIEGAGDSCDPK